MDSSPRISVLIITYKQSNLISRALDSVLKQREYVYEICVSDDCSPDDTFTILQEYKKQYPELIKIHQNKENLGIWIKLKDSFCNLFLTEIKIFKCINFVDKNYIS